MPTYFAILALPAALLLAPGCRYWNNPPLVAGQPPAAVIPLPAVPGGVPPAGAVGVPLDSQPATLTPVPSPPPSGPAQPLLVPQPLLGPPPGAVGPPPPPPRLPGLLGENTLSPRFGLPASPDNSAPLPNPLQVPVANDEVAWEEIAAVVSDYFRIASERRARRVGEVWTEGLIETLPRGGATFLEPQRRDSVGSFNRWESTLQTIRRYARVRVLPDAAGYSIGVEVQKELEDLPRPENATAGTATFRNDGSLPSPEDRDVSRSRGSPVWIPLGRDIPLEQQILAEIQSRLAPR